MPGEIAATDPARLEAVFRERPAIHRFPGNMAAPGAGAVRVRQRALRRGRSGRLDRARGTPTTSAAASRSCPGFGEMKVKALGSVLAKRFGVAGRGGARPGHTRRSATSTRARRSRRTRRRSARTRRRSGSDSARAVPPIEPTGIELTTLRDGGQTPSSVARLAAEFVAGAAAHARPRALRRPLRDRRGRARCSRRSSRRSSVAFAIRLIYNVDHPGPIPVPPPPETDPRRDRGASRRDAAGPGDPGPHAPQVRRARRARTCGPGPRTGRTTPGRGRRTSSCACSARSRSRTRSGSSSTRSGRSRSSSDSGLVAAASGEGRGRRGAALVHARSRRGALAPHREAHRQGDASASGSRPPCSPRARSSARSSRS